MDAVQIISDNLNVEKILEHYKFEDVIDSGRYTRSCCKIHGGSNPSAFVIDNETGLWFCHTGDCGGGDVFTLSQKLDNCTFSDSVKKISEILDIDIKELEIIERKSEQIKELNKFIKTMRKTKKKKINEHYSIETEIKGLASFRKFEEKTLEFFNVGYIERLTVEKKDGTAYDLRKRLVFPIVFNEINVAYLLRRTISTDVPKWSNQPTGIEMGDFLYNYDYAKHSHEIIVCEGVTDVMAYHEIGLFAVAVFHSSITDEQYKLLLKTSADLVFSFDGDEAGQKATRKAIEMFKKKANISIIQFNIDEDPEKLSREELKERYERRKKVLS